MQNVKALVQNLIDDQITPDEFTKRLQVELNSSPQPYLVPFLEVCSSSSSLLLFAMHEKYTTEYKKVNVVSY